MGRYKNLAIDIALENFRHVAHPHRDRGGVINHHIPFAALERIEFSISIADQLLNLCRQFTRMGFAAIENGDLMSARDRIADLKRSGESGAAKYQNAQRFPRLGRG